ncbi:MAG TPA: hypothetical protein VI456_08250 [Polyangia bacterium]
MISRRPLFLAAVAASVLAACGNYSNEDLLFMSAVPTSTQLAVVLPAAAPTVTQAELAQVTHNGIATVNAGLVQVLGLVDLIRSYEPTTREANARIWGPIADSKQPGWQWELSVSRPSEDATTYSYELDFQQTGRPETQVKFLTGTFDLAGGARQGSGTLTASFLAVATAGYPGDIGMTPYNTITITYQNLQTPDSPVSAMYTLLRTTPDANGIMTDTFSYEILTDGSGEIAFTEAGNIVGGTGTETVTIHAQWLASGAGMGTQTIVVGTDLGLTQTECWDATFEATYNDKPWMTTEDVNPGQMSAFCPTLPALP